MANLSHFFLNQIQKSGQSPNFWASEEYIDKAELSWVEDDQCVGFKDESGSWFFPPLDREGRFVLDVDCWAGFPNVECGKFLDYEFIYDPRAFLDLSGKKWKIFRKNVNKWLGSNWEYRRLEDKDWEEIQELLIQWGEGLELYDSEVFVRYAYQGDNRFGLFVDNILRGVNIADVNFQFINFRFCFDSGEKYLNEFLRYMFYTSDWVLQQHKLVNDGGCLGLEGLEKFKRKLCPVEIRKIYGGGKS